MNPGYLNRNSLLGEHRELHGLVNIMRYGKKGYANHPETRRWIGHGWAIKQRHRLLAAEMALRGYQDRSPVRLGTKPGQWPDTFIDAPHLQLALLRQKYVGKSPGRIPLPDGPQTLWAQHKYSVMARDIGEYQRMGRWLASGRGSRVLPDVARDLCLLLRQPPAERLLENALLHMWGYVSKHAAPAKRHPTSLAPETLLRHVQTLAVRHHVQYLLHSTALGELAAWVRA
jgi:hypothetical protein